MRDTLKLPAKGLRPSAHPLFGQICSNIGAPGAPHNSSKTSLSNAIASPTIGSASRMRQTRIDFYTSKRLSLEGIFTVPEGPRTLPPGVVVCHPHPLLGATWSTR